MPIPKMTVGLIGAKKKRSWKNVFYPLKRTYFFPNVFYLSKITVFFGNQQHQLLRKTVDIETEHDQ